MERPRVLLIDGNPERGATLRAALCDRGHEAREVASLDGALGLAPTFAPAAVIAPADLPEAEGALPHELHRPAGGPCRRDQ